MRCLKININSVKKNIEELCYNIIIMHSKIKYVYQLLSTFKSTHKEKNIYNVVLLIRFSSFFLMKL